ncbi:MAG: hypothetical protein Q7R69_00120 [bacterium]|nr:hypothetical protein [bacterium]
MQGFKDQTITSVVRPGDRSDPTKPTGIPRFTNILVRYIEVPGDQARGVAAKFFPDDGTNVEVTEYLVKKISELTAEDLRGMSPDITSQEEVKNHLAGIYNKPFGDDNLVTIWRFEYRPNAIDPDA